MSRRGHYIPTMWWLRRFSISCMKSWSPLIISNSHDVVIGHVVEVVIWKVLIATFSWKSVRSHTKSFPPPPNFDYHCYFLLIFISILFLELPHSSQARLTPSLWPLCGRNRYRLKHTTRVSLRPYFQTLPQI